MTMRGAFIYKVMNEIDIKKLIDEGRRYLKLELNYSKLTAVEKMSILLSGIALVAVLVVLGAFAMLYIGNTLVKLLATALDSQWAANLLVALLIVLLMVLLVLLRKPLIVDPITRYITKLFLSPNDDE